MDLLDEELPPPSTSSSDAAVVEVSEVHFQLNSRIRISRTCRMNWFVDYRFVNFSLDACDIGDKDFVIYGAEAADGSPLAKNALLRMTPSTKALFFAGIYKKSIVLDLSPGCFAADDCGEILYTNMLPALRKLLVELLTPFKHANNMVVHHPKVCITLIAYTPFVNFQHPPVLIHGAWVTLANVDLFLAKTEAYVRKFIDDLDIFMHPINARREASEAACYRQKLSDPSDAPPTHDDFPLNDKVSIDFRLIQMIRLGMLGLQIAPKSAHANILIVTDGVLYITDPAVVQSIAISLRASGVALSFLQVTTKNTTGCIGLVPSSDMLCFLAKISFGTHFNHEQVYDSDFVSPENGVLEHPTRFQKDFLAWSCQRDPYQMEPPLPMYTKDLFPRPSRSMRLKCDFFMLFHVRLREGYTLRSLSLHTHDSKQYITASFSLPWSVDSRIDYKISTLYADTLKDDLQNISQEVGIETNYLPTQDKKDNSLLAALFVRESEEFAIKMIGFRFNPKHYETEHLPLHRYPGIYVFLTRNRPFPTLAIKNLESSLFNHFWQPLLIADVNALSRCCDVATHRFSMPYFVDEANVVNFWPDIDSPYVNDILKPKLMEAVYAYFAKTTTFCLAAKFSWVKIIRDEKGRVPPNAGYFVRLHSDSTLLSVQIIFVGDWCIEERNCVSNKIRRDLKELEGFEGLLMSLAVGTDGKLIRYRQVPPLFGAIMPPGISSPTEPCWSTRLKIHQQALSRFLIPHRHIYKVEKDFDDYSFGQVALEGMNFIVARRRMDGYRIGFRAGAITNFIREVICEQDDIDKSINLAQRGSRLDQCIIFPPIKEPIVLKGASVQQLREHLHVVGKSLVIQDAILSVDNSPDNSTKLASSDETLKAPNPEAVPGPSILKKSDESSCTPVAVVEGLEVLTGVVDDWSTGVSLHRRGSQSTPDRITLLESTGLKSVDKPKPAKPAKRKHHKKHKKHILPKVRERQSSENSETLLAMYAPNDDPTPQDAEVGEPGPVPDPLPVVPDPVPTVVTPEEYLEKGCFIVTEYWTEPTESGEPPAGDVAKTIEEDQAMLSALVTFRAMQVELDRAPGIGTALLGAEPYSTRVKPCPAVDIAPNVSYHPHLYNVVKMCRCGERRLMLFPTLKYVFTDKDRNSRLGRILDSFNRELRSYMSQYFDFEDHDGAWATLAAGLEDELKFIDEVELEKAQAALKAAEAPKIVEPVKVVESETDNEQTADDSAETGTPTGYDSAGSNATGSNASAPRPRKVNEAAELLASLDMDALTKQILGEHSAPRKNAGSKTSTNSPKSMDGSVSSSMAPAGLQDDDDDNDAPYLPTVKKSGKSLNHKKLVQKLSSVSGNQNDSSAETASTQVENKKKRRKKKKSGGASRNASFTSFDRESIRSGKRLPEEQIDLAPLAFSVYYKRRDPKTVIVVIVPATCRAVIAITNSQVPRLPVLAFMIEEDRLLNIFQKTRSLPKEFPIRSVMNFCALSTLSALNLQVNAKSKEPNLSPGSGSPFERSTASDYDPEFTDLTDFCGNVVHELLFSRAYAHAAYTCLGINVAVPQVVLKEVLEERCLQTSVNVDSIQDVLRVTCTHLSSYLQSKRCSRYRRHQMPNVAAYSDLSSASDSDIEVQQIMNPFRYSESENDEICRMERMEFTHAFESVLKRHKFYKVPNFGEYYFYWPKKRPKPEDEDKDGEKTDGKAVEKKDAPLDKKKEEKKEPKKKKKPGEDYESGTDKTNQSDSSDEESDFDDSFEVDMQPLFLQFYVDLERYGAKFNSYPVGFIPNCLKEVMNIGPGSDRLSEEEKSRLDEFDVKMEMFVLTVPGMVSNDLCFDESLFRVEDDQFDFDLRLQDFEEDNKRPSLDLPRREIDVILKLCDGIRHMLETEKILILSRYFDTQKSYRNITRVMRFVQKEAKQVDERTQVQMAANDTLFVINEQEGMRRLAKRLEGATFSYCKIQCVKDEHSKHRDKPAMVFYCCSVDDFDAFCKEHSANAKLVKFDFVPKKKPKRGRNDTLVENGNDEDDNTTATDEITGSSTIIQKSTSDALEVEESKSDDENSLAGVEEVPEIDEKGDKEVAEDVESNPDLDEKVKRKQIVHDFWLLAKFDSNYVRSYFFQRPSGVHMNLFNKFTAKLQAEIKLVNQGLLLEDMYEKGEALPYLIREDVPTSPKSTNEPEPDPVQYPEKLQLTAYAQRYAYRPSESNSSEATDDVFSTNIADNNGEREDLISDTDASSNLRAKYQFGYFACPKVWHHWFGINPRLRREPNVGVMALMDELENLQLLNRKNVYKVKDEHGNIFYMSLFNDLPSVQNAMPTENEKFMEEVAQRIESSVVLVIFGIATPSTDITVQLMKQLQKRLDARVLEELQSAVYKNPQLGLEPTDVSFLQHNPDAPAETFFYSLPNVASEYLASVHTYLEQHLAAYFITPRYVESSVVRCDSVDYYTPLVISNCTRQHRLPGSNFEHFPVDGIEKDPMPEHYEPLIFVVNKPKREGQRTSGMGCFEVRLVDRKGKVVDNTNSKAYPPGKLGSDSFSLLYPGFSGAKPFSRSNKFQDQTKCTLVESLETDANFITSEHFVAFYVWQAGDIGLQELKTRLRILCQQAMADVVFEFGVLSQPILEPVPPPASPEELAICASPLNRQNSDNTRTPLNKRNSDAASCLQTVPSNLSLPRPSAPTTPVTAEKANNFIVPPTVHAVDTPPPYGAPQKTRLITNTGWASVANQGYHRIGYKPPIPRIDSSQKVIVPKVTQCSTWIPPCVKNTPEMLRPDFVESLNNFFNFMSRESQRYPEMSQSFSKTRFVLDSERLAPAVLRVIYAKFVATFENDNVVILKQLYTPTSTRLETMTDFGPLMHNPLIFDKGHAVELKDDFRVLDYVVIVQSKVQMTHTIQVSQSGGVPTPEVEKVIKDPRKAHLKFGPKAEPFVPRRRLLFVTIKGEILTLFQYNMEAEIMQTVTDIVERTVFWNNARCRLLREIGLHKMRVSHLTTLVSGDARDELYQPLKWRDPLILVSHDYPPDSFRPADYPIPPKDLSSKFLRLYRLSNPDFVLKHNSPSKFDDQITQFLALRQDIRDDVTKIIDLKEAHATFLAGMGGESVLLEDDILFRILDRVQECHYVETPVLLFPEWRKKVAAIRGSTTVEHGSVSRRRQKQSTPTKNPVRKKVSLEAKMKPRSQTVTQSMLPALCRTNSTDEASTLRLQGQLLSEYTHYLCHHLNAVLIKLPLKLAGSPHSPKGSGTPVNWLAVATSAGFVLLHLSFVEPYFCLRILTWDKSQIKLPVSDGDLHNLICVKNSIVSKCHLHSFTYDFHLRIMSNYLMEQGEAPFSRGYNTSAFLIDFLQYYTCRPPSARNCIFEENCVFKDNLKVPGASVWEDFLKNDHKYSWKVVKLKVSEKEDADEYMLVSSNEKQAANYNVIRLVTNTTPASKVKENELYLRYYVLMVAEEVGIVEAMGIPTEESAFRLVDQGPELNDTDDDIVVEGELAYDSSGSSDHGALFKRNKLRSSAQSITSGTTSVSERLSDLETSCLTDNNSGCPSPGSTGGTLIDDNMTPQLSSTFTARDLPKRPKGSATQIHREPPRGHRKKTSGTYTDFIRLVGQIPREQVTYVQYVNSFQTSVQNELIKITDEIKTFLKQAVATADHSCYVEHLWRKMLSSKDVEPKGVALGLLQRLDGTADPPLKQVASTELTSSEWETFLSHIRRDPMEVNDPRVLNCLAGVNYQQLFRFFVEYFGGGKRCRYFEFPHSKNLIIVNCLYLENATLIEHRDNRLSMAFLYKTSEVSASNATFVSDWVTKQFDEVMRCLSAFVWTDLMANRPSHTR